MVNRQSGGLRFNPGNGDIYFDKTFAQGLKIVGESP